MTVFDEMRGYVHTHDRNGGFMAATTTTEMYQMIDKADVENRKLRELLYASQHCDDDDFDGRECPLYDENEPNRCKMDRLLIELRIDE